MKLHRNLTQLLCRAGLGFCAALLLTGTALATWSIVAVNTKTGEVLFASATCIDGFYLQPEIAVVRPGVGAAACQSLIDSNTVNRKKIWNMMGEEYALDDILERILATDNHAPVRQYGLVNFVDFPVTFTGPQCGEARYGVSGIIDDIRYAIQGNVLTGVIPVYNAENAFVSTVGDMGQRVMAAMEAARVMGGDGRCSCDINAPTHCGAPPPSFEYSAYTAFLVIARMGDVEGVCENGFGCANGTYYCNLTAVSGPGGPEPVLWLEERYAGWRDEQRGFADHILTDVTAGAQAMPGDGITRTTVDVQLRDIDGHAVVHHSATLKITRDYDGPAVARIGQITNHGDGHFSFGVTANTDSGQGKWKIEVIHGEKTVRLWPDLAIRVDPVTELHSGYDHVSASNGATVPLVLNVPADAGARYLVLASASGTRPGQVFDGLSLPLNKDALFLASLSAAGSSHFPGTIGSLDLVGHAQGGFVAPPGLLEAYIGRHVDWCAVVHGAVPHVTNLAGFDVGP